MAKLEGVRANGPARAGGGGTARSTRWERSGAPAVSEATGRIMQEPGQYTTTHTVRPGAAGDAPFKERVRESCRDLGGVMIEACRCVGLPARSCRARRLDPNPERYDLHARQ